MPSPSDTLKRLEAALTELGLRFALIGGMAVILRGYDRATQDVDVLVLDVDDVLPLLLAAFEKHGFGFRVADPIDFAKQNRVILLRAPDGTGIDVSMGVLPLELEIIERSTQETLMDGISMPVATAEDLIIMKLVAARNRDLDDVTRLVELYPDLDVIRIRRIVTEYAEALEQPEIVQHLDDILGPR